MGLNEIMPARSLAQHPPMASAPWKLMVITLTTSPVLLPPSHTAAREPHLPFTQGSFSTCDFYQEPGNWMLVLTPRPDSSQYITAALLSFFWSNILLSFSNSTGCDDLTNHKVDPEMLKGSHGVSFWDPSKAPPHNCGHCRNTCHLVLGLFHPSSCPLQSAQLKGGDRMSLGRSWGVLTASSLPGTSIPTYLQCRNMTPSPRARLNFPQGSNRVFFTTLNEIL